MNSAAVLSLPAPWAERIRSDAAAVVQDQPAARWINLTEIAFPNRHQLGVIVGPTSARILRQFEQAAVPRGFIVHSESVAQERDLIPALERLLARSDVLIAIPDSVVHNRSTVQPLLMTTYRAGVPVIGFSESYSLAGAVASLHSSPDQIGRQVAEVVSGALKGRFSPGILGPRYFRVTTNSTVARSLGITVPGGAVLEERIEAVEREAPAP